MSVCEMCGKGGNLTETKVEGSLLQLCSGCSSYGQVLAKPIFRQRKPMFSSKPGDDLVVITNYAQKLQKIRNEKNMTQKEFATLLQEKLSVISKWESGTMKPNINTAKRLERVLKITLLKKSNETKTDDKDSPSFSSQKSKASAGFTLGDFIKVRKR
jgi:putative transcription factor